MWNKARRVQGANHLMDGVNRLFRVERGEWPKLIQFGLFGFLLQMGMGIGFSVGDAAFFSNVGAEALPTIFMLTPLVMLIYTGVFSVLMLRFALDHMVMLTLALLMIGGLIFGILLDAGGGDGLYYALKLYLAMWYIAIYTLFWNYTDAYFHIQDAKRLFPLFAAFCALGTASGALIVNLFADMVSVSAFLLMWAAVALATMPWVRLLGRRWQTIAEHEGDDGDDAPGLKAQLGLLARGLRTSRFTIILAATLFVTLLMTNLAEFQYATVLQQGRSEAELAALFGALYAASNVVNLFVCLFVFNRLVSRIGVRNVAFILPLSYFAVFGFFFLSGGYAAALAAFFAYHAVLTSIEYNNQNLLFNAVPASIKRPLRTVVEGMCEPLASLIAGGFLLYAAKYLDLRELSGIGVLLGAVLIAIVLLLRQFYPAAMAQNMRRGWLDFSADRAALAEPLRLQLEEAAANDADPLARQARELLERPVSDAAPDEDREKLSAMLAAAPTMSPRDRRGIADMLIRLGETAIPHLVAVLHDDRRSYIERAVAAQTLARLSHAQFIAQADRLVPEELCAARLCTEVSAQLGAVVDGGVAVELLGRAQRERAGAAVDFALELLALRGLLPNSDLLIVSLHSANVKVRANAMEAVEAGAGHTHYAQIRAVLQPQGAGHAKVAPLDTSGIVAVADTVLDRGNMIERAAALEILAHALPRDEFARRIARLIDEDMPSPLRTMLLDHLGVVRDGRPTLLALVEALRGVRYFGAATLQTLVDLAGLARFDKPDGPAFGGEAAGQRFWISHHDLADAAGRHPDLALVMLRTQDGRAHAA